MDFSRLGTSIPTADLPGIGASMRTPAPAVDHPAPEFTAPLLSGGAFSLSEMRGTPVVLNYWATWCGPCRAEMPAIQTAAEGRSREWLTKQSRRSPRYTTDWNEIPLVKAKG